MPPVNSFQTMRIRRTDVPAAAARALWLERGPLIRVVVALLAVWALWQAGTWYLDRPDIRVDSEVRAAAPAALTTAGPPAGDFQEAWRAIVPEHNYGYEYRPPKIAGGHVVVQTNTGVVAYDARTGERGWYYRESTGRLDEMTVTGDTVVVNLLGADDDNWYSRTVGLDARTGRVLWDNDDGIAVDERSTAARAGVLVTGTENDWRGVDARTGKTRWRLDDSDVADWRCRPKPTDREAGAPRADVLVVTVGCGDPEGKPDLMTVVDAASGTPLWTVKVTGSVQWDKAGVAVLYQKAADDRPKLVGRDGRRLLTFPAGETCVASCLVSLGDRLGVVMIEDERQLTLVSPTTGHPEKVDLPVPYPDADPYGYLLASGQRAYVQTGTHLTVIDAGTGRTERTPLPVERDEAVVAVGGGRLFSVRQSSAQVDRGVLEVAAFEPTRDG